MPASEFSLTAKQKEAQKILSGDATYLMLFGGSRSGKTFLHLRNLVMRALKAPGSRHCVLRFRFNHVKQSVVFDTFPKVMRLCFPEIEYKLDKTDWYVKLPNNSEIWFGGLDDKQRTEKILGSEFVTIYLNECSQISWNSVSMVTTRLAQQCEQFIANKPVVQLKPRMFFDCNPPNKLHWTYKLFIKKIQPDNDEPIEHPDNYASLLMNPKDNEQNLTDNYIQLLEDMPARFRRRFLLGEFADSNPNALFDEDIIDKWRVNDGSIPDLLRVCVAVDPSGAGDEDNAENDEIGIIVAGLGTDGNCYVLEDLTCKCGPQQWGTIVASAFDRNDADFVTAETNYGGAMVKFVIQTANPRIPYREAHAARGKVIRAEPVAALYEQGKVRHCGMFNKLEEELTGFTTFGYTGDRSPNHADALVWAVTALFPGLVNVIKPPPANSGVSVATGDFGWMG